MFSGFRNVVENLAQPQPRPSRPQHADSQDAIPERPDHHRASGSFDLSSVALSTGHMAESAFSNLRKSIAAQRPFMATSPTGEASSSRASPQPDRELKPVSKPTLEDRLRANFSIGDASVTPSPGPSHTSSPKPPPVAADVVLSPRTVPLPDSPVQGSIDGLALPHPLADPPRLELSGSRNEDRSSATEAGSSVSSAPQDVEAPPSNPEVPEILEAPKSDDSPKDTRYPEADVPLPLLSPVPTNLAASQSIHSFQMDELPQEKEETDDSGARLDTLERTYSGNAFSSNCMSAFHREITRDLKGIGGLEISAGRD